MNKEAFRKKYKTLRKSMSEESCDASSLAIANKALQLDVWEAEFYHLFLSIETQKEVNTEYLLNILSGKDKNIVIAKSNFELLTMSHFLLTDNTLIKPNDWGIPEPQSGIPIPPEQLDVIFIPLLAFDEKGNRLGYGKGFYDRFLKNCRPDVLKIGLSFFEAEKELPTTAYDLPLTHCVTPNKLYIF